MPTSVDAVFIKITTTPGGSVVHTSTAVYGVRVGASLDEAGAWSFWMPNEALDITYVKPFNYVEIWSTTSGVDKKEGGGIILGIDDRFDNRNNRTMVYGFDWLYDLGRVLVDEEEVSELVWVTPHLVTVNVIDGGPQFDLSNTYDDDPTTFNFVELNPHPGVDASWLYIGYEAPFFAAKYDLKVDDPLYVNTIVGTVQAEPFDDREWAVRDLDSDTTAVGGVPWVQDGIQRWPRNSRELQVEHAEYVGYWTRIRANAGTDFFLIRGIEIEVAWPTSDDVDTIIGYASGWSVEYAQSPTGRPGRVAYSVRKESVLLCLNRSAEMTNEHFRLKAPGSKIVTWLGDGWVSSGITAMHPDAYDPDDADVADHCIITRLTRKTDYSEIVTRCYPLGNGGDGAQVDLSALDTDDITVPSGYSIDKANNLIVNDDLETALGVERLANWEFPEIAPLSKGVGQSRANSLALADAALAKLIRSAGDAVHYDIEVEGLQTDLQPGDTMIVSYPIPDASGANKEIISTSLVITATEKRFTTDGRVMWDLSVSTNGTHALTPERMAANQQKNLATRLRHPAPVPIHRVGGYVQAQE